MEKSSLFQFLLRKFGIQFGVLLMLAASVYYVIESNSSADFHRVALLQDSKQLIEQAARKGLQYLDSSKSKDLDEYNHNIIQLGTNFTELVESFKKSPELQARFLDVQNKSKDYFLKFNEKIAKRQSGSSRDHNQTLTEVPDSSEVALLIDDLSKDIRENSSQPLLLFGLKRPMVWWLFLAGLALGSFCVLAGQFLQRKAFEEQDQNIAQLNIQSILVDGILNSISEALIVTDEHGRFTKFNTASQRLIGSKIKSISSENDAKEFGFFDVNTMKQFSLMEMPFARALQGENVDDMEILVHNETHPEGIYISISSRFLSDIDGSIRGALVVFRDISRRKATEKEWLRARESALETARKKSEFLAAMSHEIRTPMNGVIGMATLLQETKMTAEQKDYVGTIQHSAEALLRLINDILDHSKIEAGKVQINPRPFDMQILVEDVLELFRPMVREKNVSLEAKFRGRDEWYLVGDPERLRQVLVNLLGNAMKFTEVGGVSITVEALKSHGGKTQLKVSVTDTGPGMSEDESQFLFQKYFQTKSGMKYGGTGLGLSICHQLIELMGGQIGLQSQVRVGSTFWFTLELPESSVDQIPAQKEHHFASLFSGRILLVEDQPVNQRVASTYLQKLGLEVDIAGNGQIALDMVQRKKYDLIFMDCQMPVMTGYEATQKIRQLPDFAKLPIIALTAEGTSGERQSCLKAGMDDFLTKPLELEKLVEVLNRWMKSTQPILDKAALEKLSQYVVNNKSLILALIEDFEKTAPGLVETIVGSGDWEQVKQAAHALKSASAALGATGLAELCQKIENGSQPAEVKTLLESVQENLSHSLQELQKYAARAAA